MSAYPAYRFAIFIATLGGCALLERLAPRRVRVAPAGGRAAVNLGLLAASVLTTRALLPIAAVEAAYRAEAARWGLLNLFSIPFPLKVLLSVVILDLAIYWQHRLFHAIPALWRVHAVHHTDLDLDATSGVRFHPVEILLSTMIKIAITAVFGLHFLGVALFEVILSSTAVFNHSNLHLGWLDPVVRLFAVTPDMHRIHHSPSREETDSNFGFNIPWWDRWFGTYRAEPKENHSTMTLGLAGARKPDQLTFGALLLRPFRRQA